MRQYIIASHAHFATGIKESVELLSGNDGNSDISSVHGTTSSTRKTLFLVT